MSRITMGLLLLSSAVVGMGVCAPAMALNTFTFTTDRTITTPVVLTDDTIYVSPNNSSISFAAQVDGAYSLKVSNGAGAVAFADSVGSTTALTGLTIIGGTWSASSLVIDGDLSVTTSSGDITQTSGGFDVTGNATFDAGLGSVILDNPGNYFTGAVYLAGGNVNLTNSQATALSGAAIFGTLNVASNGALSQIGALTVTGAATFTQNSTTAGTTQDIDLGTQANDFHSGVTFAAGAGVAINNLALKNTNVTPGTLTLPASVAGNLTLNYTNAGLALPVVGVDGALDVLAGGGITINDDVTTGGAQSYHSAVTLGANVTLAATSVNLASNLTGAGFGLTIAGNATLGAASGLATLEVSGTSSLNGNISTSGSQTYTGAVTLVNDSALSSSSAGTIAFTSAATGATQGLTVATAGLASFGGATTLKKLTVDSGTFAASDVLTIGTDGLSVTTSAGDIAPTGPFAVIGASNFDASTNAIALTNANNDFTGTVSLTGTTTQIADKNSLTLGSLNTGNLTVTTAGALNLGSGNITGNLGATSNGGTITQSGALTVAGVSSIDAGNGNSTLASANNDFVGAVNLTGGPTQVVDKNALTLGTLNTGNLTVTSAGALNLGSGSIAGDLGATSNGGTIAQSGALIVAGVSSIDAGNGNITLASANNDFVGAVSVSGAGISMTDNNDLNVTQLTDGANGAVSLIAGGALTLPAGSINTGTADLTLAANGGALSSPGALSGRNVTLAGRDGLTLSSTISAIGIASLTSSNGAINQTGGMLDVATLTGSSSGHTVLTIPNKVGTLGSFSATNFALTNAQALAVSGPLMTTGGTGDIQLVTTSGALNVSSDLSGGDVALTSAVNLTLSHDVNATTVNLVSGGDLSQIGSILTAGTLTGSSTGSATLNGGNRLGTLGSFSAANFALTNAQALTVMGPVDGGPSTALTTTSGDLVINGALTGTTTTLTSAGATGEGSAGVITAGTLAGSSVGDTTLNGANQIGTLGSFSGANVALTNAQALAVSGPLSTAGGTGNIQLATTSGALNVNTNLSGGAVALTSAGNLAVGGDVTGNQVSLTAPAGTISAAISTSGGLSISTAPGVMQVQSGADVTGATELADGTLQVDGGASIGAITVDAGATLTGVGSAGDITNHGVVAPGVPGTPYGSLTSAKYAGNGTLQIAADAASSSNASLSVGGDATLDGILRLDIGSSQPSKDTVFAVLLAGAVHNEFGSVSAPGSLMNPKAQYTATAVTVVFPMTVGGTITGLTSAGLTLQLNGGNDLVIAENSTSFTFDHAFHTGDSYIVGISQQPAGQLCTLTHASGTIVDDAVSDVVVTCEVAQAQLSLSVDDGHDFVRYGQIINYVVTLTNSGNATAHVNLSSVLDPGLDAVYTRWICFGGDGSSQCAANGSGPLQDGAVVLPAGRTLTWLVSTPVQVAAAGGTVATTVTATPDDTSLVPSDATDTDTVVLYRDGFDVPYGDGTMSADPTLAHASATLQGDAIDVFKPADTASTGVVDTLRVVHLLGDDTVQVQRTELGGAIHVRLLLHSADGREVAGTWATAKPGATLAIGLVGRSDGTHRSALLEGAESAMSMALPDQLRK